MPEKVKKLRQSKIPGFKGICQLARAVKKDGFNLTAILGFAALMYPERTVLHDHLGKITCRQLYMDSINLALILKQEYDLRPEMKVALICKNHIIFVQSMFALFRLGVHIFLLNADMSRTQLEHLIEIHKFNLIILDPEKDTDLVNFDENKRILTSHTVRPSITGLMKIRDSGIKHLKRSASGKMVVLSSGSTGDFKVSSRKPPIWQTVIPFITILKKIKIYRFRSVYIATPLYHSYALSSLVISIFLGAEIFILPGFESEKVCELIRSFKIESVTIVPLMLVRLLSYDERAFLSLKCIISSGAPLDGNIAQKILKQFGEILYNLYGTTETGICVIATPQDLKNHPFSIGKKIKGVSLKIMDEQRNEVETGKSGMIYVRSKWGMERHADRWFSTGDLGYVDEDGYFYVIGRKDQMIISGGENVYPEKIEKILGLNNQIECAAVTGVHDDEFGQRLNAFIVLKPGACQTEESILKWLSDIVARYEMPARVIILDSLPLLATGKVNKSALSENTDN